MENKQLERINESERWFHTIPQKIRKALEQFALRQWQLLSLLARCRTKYVLDFVNNNPAIVFCLANNWIFHKPAVQRPLRSARSLLTKKQKDILAWLGFPGTNAARRVLKKISASSLSVPRLLYLRDAMFDSDVFKLLCHIPRINPGIIRILSDKRLFTLIQNSFIHELSHVDKDLKSLDVAEKLKEVAQISPQLSSRINSIEDLLQCSEQLKIQKYLQNFKFPEAPVPGLKDIIVPITTPKELYLEGKIQNHCVADYIPLVSKGRMFFYKIIQPERCTLGLTKKKMNWEIFDIRGKSNSSICQRTLCFICQWLS